MELADVVRRRKMVRSFSGVSVPEGVLDDILALACAAPSAGNTGGWDAVVLAGAAQTSAFWDATTTPDWRARSRRWPGLARAPVIVALFVDPEAYRARYREPDKRASDLGGGGGDGSEPWPVPYWFVDGGFAALVMLLAASTPGSGRASWGTSGARTPCGRRSASPTTAATSGRCSWASRAATTRLRPRWRVHGATPARSCTGAGGEHGGNLELTLVARIAIPGGEGGDAVQVWTLRPEMGRAVNRLVDAAYNKSILPVRVREAARMRIAQLNECPVCLGFRATSVKDQGVPEDFYRHIGDHDAAGDYSQQERLAIEYAERFALDHLGIDDAFFARLAECFTDAEILDLTICLAAFLGLGRMLRSLGIDETSLLDV